MEIASDRPRWDVAHLSSLLRTVLLACFVAVLSYGAAALGAALVLRPDSLSTLWPGCIVLVSVLLLVPRKTWPVLIVTALAVFYLNDRHSGVPASTAALLALADTVEVLIAVLCLSYFFEGVPRLNSVTALAKFSLFAVILAPAAGAMVGALAVPGTYWTNWRTSFFSEALGFLTLMPAILGWVGTKSRGIHKSRAYYLEGAALIAGLLVFGYIVFVAPGNTSPPALFYSLVPFMLW